MAVTQLPQCPASLRVCTQEGAITAAFIIQEQRRLEIIQPFPQYVMRPRSLFFQVVEYQVPIGFAQMAADYFQGP